jgi:hypothetical protein
MKKVVINTIKKVIINNNTIPKNLFKKQKRINYYEKEIMNDIFDSSQEEVGSCPCGDYSLLKEQGYNIYKKNKKPE